MSADSYCFLDAGNALMVFWIDFVLCLKLTDFCTSWFWGELWLAKRKRTGH